MIEEFVVPRWVRLVTRMSGRHVLRATGWRRRRPPVVATPVPVLPDVQPVADVPDVAEPLPRLADLQAAAGPSSNEVPAAVAAADAVAVDIASAGPIDPERRDDRITHEFLLATRAMTARVQGLIVVPDLAGTAGPGTSPHMMPPTSSIGDVPSADPAATEGSATFVPDLPAEVTVALPAVPAADAVSSAIAPIPEPPGDRSEAVAGLASVEPILDSGLP